MIFSVHVSHKDKDGSHEHALSGACNVFSERVGEESVPVIELIALEVVIDHGERAREIDLARLSAENRTALEEAIIENHE